MDKVMECKVVNLLIKCLRVPLGDKYKDLKTWEPVIEIFEMGLAS